MSLVFGDTLEQVERYHDLLATAGVERGLIGPRETPRLWERHLLNCAGVSDLVEDGQVVADLGSGAGLPGLVLALQRPQVRVVLVEPLLRRATFLTEAVAELGLANAEVRRARAEDLHGALVVDAVTARAVAPVDRLAGWALPLLPPGGRLLALKGDRAGAELAAAAPVLRRLGARSWSVVDVGSPDLGTQGRVVVVEAGTSPAPDTKARTTSRTRKAGR